jgi:hypothetical protein
MAIVKKPKKVKAKLKNRVSLPFIYDQLQIIKKMFTTFGILKHANVFNPALLYFLR